MATATAEAKPSAKMHGTAVAAWWESRELARTVGMWSAFATAAAFAIGTLTYLLEGHWPGIDAYAADFSNIDLLPWVFFALIAVFFLLTVLAIHATTPASGRFLSTSGLGFTLAYATLCITTCVLQFTYVRYRINDGNLAVLEPWASASPKPATFAVDNLAFFLQGIATLCLAPLFRGNRLHDTIRRLFVVNAIGCVALILLATFMGFETDFRHGLYLATTVAWAVLLGTALVLVGLAFGRRPATVTTTGDAVDPST